MIHDKTCHLEVKMTFIGSWTSKYKVGYSTTYKWTYNCLWQMLHLCTYYLTEDFEITIELIIFTLNTPSLIYML